MKSKGIPTSVHYPSLLPDQEALKNLDSKNKSSLKNLFSRKSFKSYSIDNAKEIALDYVIQSDKKFGKGSLVLIQKAWQEIFPFNDEPIHTIYTESNGSNSWIGLDDGIVKVYTNEFEKVISNINYKSIKIK